jgi:hypothetical protein
MKFSTALQSILEAYEGDGLSPDIWLSDGSMIPEIRNKLHLIAKDFSEQHSVPPEAIEDVILTGSMANFNWSDLSDVDVHVVVNFDMVDENHELLRDYYQLAKSVWNSSHDIKICNHEVEVYIQDSQEPHHSTGIYSIQYGEWLSKPEKNTSAKPSNSSVQQKAKDFVARIDRIERMVKEGPGRAFDEAEKVRDRIKSMRKAGLESAGEFSIENLAFKYLRNNGHLNRLSRLRRVAYDDQFTVTNCETEPSDRQQPKGIGEDVAMRLQNLNRTDTMTFKRGDTLEIVREADDFDPNQDTVDFTPPDDGMVSGKEIVDASRTLDNLDAEYRAGKNPNMPLDFEGRLELALKDSKAAAQTASFAAREVNQLRHDMQRGFGDIMTKLDKIGSGEPMTDPDPPGSSIWDEDFEGEL